MADLPELLERIYASGEVEDEHGARVAALPTGVGRGKALELARLTRDEGLENTLEIGLAYGLSALAIAGVHSERGRGRHTAIDPHARTTYRSIGPLNLSRAGFDDYVEVIDEGSEIALPRLAAARPAGFDLVLIDGRHHLDTTLIDFFYADRLLADGGYVVVDDVEYASVERALAYVLSNRAYEPVSLSAEGVATLRKLHDDDREWDHHVAFESLELQTWFGGEKPRRRHPLPTRRSASAPEPVRSATLSFAISTRGPAERVRALLELVRPHADEIVLTVNRDGGLDTLDACADLADRRLTYEFDDSPSRLIGWVLHQCSGDWILRLDDDEVPSAALLQELPDLIRDRRPSELFIKRHWLYRDPGQMITGPAPWNAEYQSRGLRNLPGTWRFDGRVHSDVRVAGERRHVEAPIYHCALLLSSLETREERALAYELLRPGISYGGLPTNGMYLPELVEGVESEPVPDEDRLLIDRVLSGSPARAGIATGPEAHATAADVDAFNGTRTVSLGAYDARLEFVAPPDRVLAGSTRHLEMRVTNRGNEVWPAGETEPLIRLGYRWRDRTRDRVVMDGRVTFSETVEPGATTLTLLAVRAPEETGPYELEVDVLHEHVRWFDCAVTLRLRVDPDPGSLLVASPRLPVARLEADLLSAGTRLGEERRASQDALAGASGRLRTLRAQRGWRAANLLSRPLDSVRRRRR